MDAALFAKMLSDKNVLDLKKLHYKYPQADLAEFIALLQDGFYKTVPLPGLGSGDTVYLLGATQVRLSAAKLLLTPQNGEPPYGVKAMEDEILSTFRIEHIDTGRDSVRRVLAGSAPADESEGRIYGMKKGLEFIADPANRISEENLHHLYRVAVGNTLPEDDRLPAGALYRRDAVYVVGDKVEHVGLPWQALPRRMAALAAFAQQPSEMNDLLKAAILHFYLAWLHPYFDGNGRMARLLHLWYLVQQGYSSALYVPLSRYIEQSRARYYNDYSLVEANAAISGVLDVTPFLAYFIEEVYHKFGSELPAERTAADFTKALAEGHITEKEKALWQFVLSAYGNREFSTKQLEKEFGQAAYATIRSFVLKFERLGLLSSQKYGARVKYRVKN